MAIHIQEFTNEPKKFELIEPGRYEVEVHSAEWAQTRNTKEEYINLIFQIRKDVEQTNKGRLVFKPIFKNKDTGDYPQVEISKMLGTVENPKRDFETYDDLLQYLCGLKMSIEVVIQPADERYPNSKDKNIVKYLSYEPTKYPNGNTAGYVGLDVADDDLPF